jgi:DNA processing protein
MADIGTWLALKSVPGVGNLVYKQLIVKFASPEKVFSATEAELTAVEGVSPRLARAVRTHRPGSGIREEIRRAGQLGCRIIPFDHPDYPSLLRHIPDPPPYLYVRGRFPFFDNSIAFVGARKASGYGMAAARRLAGELAAMGWTIVSGMARGIDTAAHKGALEAGGRTVAVMGSGFAEIYPPENRMLCDRIGEQGAVISEFSVNEPPNAYNFPARNRIISGMTLGTVVVEASAKSGSLITARLAAEQGREVFAIPGSIHSHTSQGTHSLLKQGAKLVTAVDDIIEEFARVQVQRTVDGIETSAENPGSPDEKRPLPHPAGSAGLPADLSPEQLAVLTIIDAYPAHIDDLCRKSGVDAGRLSGLLLTLELMGLITQQPGKYFCLKEESR